MRGQYSTRHVPVCAIHNDAGGIETKGPLVGQMSRSRKESTYSEVSLDELPDVDESSSVSEFEGREGAKKKMFGLYARDRCITAFMHLRWWHANLNEVATFVPLKGTIVDLGCGYGFFANYIALESSYRNVLGVELSARKIRYANRHLPNTTFVNGDIGNLDLPPCDAILLLHVLHHLDSFAAQVGLLQLCVRQLSERGVLIIEEIDETPWYKYLLTRCVDHALYGKGPFYFRKQREWKKLLSDFKLDVRIYSIHKGKPLSHVMYVASKVV